MAKPHPAKTDATPPFTGTTPRSIWLAAILSLVAALAFVRPYLGTLLFSMLLAYIFNPVYKLVRRRGHRSGLAISATILAMLLTFLIPAALITGITISQASTLAAKFQDHAAASTANAAGSDDALARGTARVNAIIDALPGGEKVAVDQQQLQSLIRKAGSAFLEGAASFIRQTGQTITNLITISILAFFLIAGALRNQDALLSFIRNLSPFDGGLTDSYLEKAGLMTKAMVKGQLLIALAQGLASAFSLWLAGLDYFLFFFVILSFLSFIPLGAGIVTIPLGIILALTGQPWQGVFIVLYHLLVVTNIDNILRPYLVPKAARLNPAILLLAVFSGMALFGAIGVVYGPILMIMIVTSLDVYAAYNRQAVRPHLPGR